MKKQWPALSNWQDFEELCESLYQAEHSPTQCFRYGRAGQAQHGVDIVAKSGVNGLWTGVQCKLKTELVGSALSEQQLIDAYQLSTKFAHGLEKLIVATTSASDRTVQDLAIQITDSHQRKHPVEILWWDQVEALLDRHTDVAKRFYPEHFAADAALVETPNGSLHITLRRESAETSMRQLFQSDQFCGTMGSLAGTLASIVSEMVDNAFNPGKGGATRIYLALSEGVLSVRDNGKRFNPIDNPISLLPSMKGLRGIRRALADSSGSLVHRYFEADFNKTRFNQNQITIVSETASLLATCRASAPGLYLLSREAAFKFVSGLEIPPNCETFTLRLLGDNTMNFSSTAQLVSSLLNRLNGRRLCIKISEDCQKDIVEALQLEAIEHPEVRIDVV